MTDLLPDEIFVRHAPGYIKEAGIFEVLTFVTEEDGATEYIRADLVSTPNKPAEVDLDALKKPEPVFYDGYSEYRRGYERGKQLGWNDCIDHLATGKGWGVSTDIGRTNGLLKALEWFVENDETNESDPKNKFYINGLNFARAEIAKAKQNDRDDRPSAYWVRYNDGSGVIYENKGWAEAYAERALLKCAVIPVYTQPQPAEPCGDVQPALDAKIKRYEDALHYLIERADDSNDARYGTLSASFVRDVCSKALEGTE